MKRVNGLYFFLMYKPTACVMINTCYSLMHDCCGTLSNIIFRDLELFPYFFVNTRLQNFILKSEINIPEKVL